MTKPYDSPSRHIATALMASLLLGSLAGPSDGAQPIPTLSRAKGAVWIISDQTGPRDVLSTQRAREGDVVATEAGALADLVVADVARARFGPSSRTRLTAVNGRLALDVQSGSVCVNAERTNATVQAGPAALQPVGTNSIFSLARDSDGGAIVAVYRGDVRASATGGSIDAHIGEALLVNRTGAVSKVALPLYNSTFAPLECPSQTIIAQAIEAANRAVVANNAASVAAGTAAESPAPASPRGSGGGALLTILLGGGLLAGLASGSKGGAAPTSSPTNPPSPTPGPTATPTPSPTATPTPAPTGTPVPTLVVSPTALTLAVGSGPQHAKSFTVSEAGTTGPFTASVSGTGCSIAPPLTRSPGIAGGIVTFTVTAAIAGGTCGVSVTDGRTAVPVSITVVGPVGAPGSITVGPTIGAPTNVTVTDTNAPNGTSITGVLTPAAEAAICFNAAPNPCLRSITATTTSGATTFTFFGRVGTGSATVTFTDPFGNSTTATANKTSTLSGTRRPADESSAIGYSPPGKLQFTDPRDPARPVYTLAAPDANGPFSATSGDPTKATVHSGPGPKQFTIAPGSVIGTTTITFADARGATAVLNIGNGTPPSSSRSKQPAVIGNVPTSPTSTKRTALLVNEAQITLHSSSAHNSKIVTISEADYDGVVNVISSNPAVVAPATSTVQVRSIGQLQLIATGPGNASITLTDSSGQQVTLNVTVIATSNRTAGSEPRKQPR